MAKSKTSSQNASSEKVRNGLNFLPLSIKRQAYSSMTIPQVQHGSILPEGGINSETMISARQQLE
jgi:hypothetical protein